MKKLLILPLLALFLPCLLAQTVDEIVQKNIEVSGGLEAIKSKNTVRMTGTFELPSMGVTADLVMIRKRPNLQRTEIVVQGMTILNVFDGTTRWKVEPYRGVTEPEKASATETEEIAFQADFDGVLLNYKQKGHTLELLGKETVEGKEAYRLKLKAANGREVDVWIDTTTYHEVKMAAKTTVPEQGEQVVESFLSDYRPVDGVVVAHAMENRVGDFTMKFTITKIEWNVDVPDSLFQMPAPAQPAATPAQP